MRVWKDVGTMEVGKWHDDQINRVLSRCRVKILDNQHACVKSDINVEVKDKHIRIVIYGFLFSMDIGENKKMVVDFG